MSDLTDGVPRDVHGGPSDGGDVSDAALNAELDVDLGEAIAAEHESDDDAAADRTAASARSESDDTLDA